MPQLWCPNGCDELPASGVCRQCGYDGVGVSESETVNAICNDGRGHWYLRPRLPEIYAVEPNENWVLNQRDSKAFVDALLNPPKPNESLRNAAARYRSVRST